MSLFVGFDLSTQSHSTVVVDENFKVVKEGSVNFDTDLPHYNTQGIFKLFYFSPQLIW